MVVVEQGVLGGSLEVVVGERRGALSGRGDRLARDRLHGEVQRCRVGIVEVDRPRLSHPERQRDPHDRASNPASMHHSSAFL